MEGEEWQGNGGKGIKGNEGRAVLTFAEVLAEQNVEGEVTRPSPGMVDPALRGAGILTSPSRDGPALMHLAAGYLRSLSLASFNLHASQTLRSRTHSSNDTRVSQNPTDKQA